jgi:hypothetical protein
LPFRSLGKQQNPSNLGSGLPFMPPRLLSSAMTVFTVTRYYIILICIS